MIDTSANRLQDTTELQSVRDVIAGSIRDSSLSVIADEVSAAFLGGKMLRARMTLKVGLAVSSLPVETIINAAAAIEMVQAASLLHDDVVDGGILRRGVPAFWRSKGIAGAVILGDLMVCKAFALLDTEQSRHLSSLLVQLTGEMCEAEAEQELTMSKSHGDFEQSVLLARRKTGALFAFAAAAGALPNSPQAAALREAGYQIGTAYQLADDVLDSSDSSVSDGKDLGKDALSDKLTSMSAKDSSKDIIVTRITDLLASSCALLEEWPTAQNAIQDYLSNEFKPIIDAFTQEHCEVSTS
jgi:geranylgeranyl pyrophosphate synthase